MAGLSNSTYGKGTTVTSAELADRITAVLDSAYGALDTLDHGSKIAAVADQGALNSLRKSIQDLGVIAADARKAASDDAAKAADDRSKAAAPGAPKV
jgi:hypothetical protein